MNSKAGASHVGKQLFFEDEYIAFKIALDMNNIDELKSKKEDLKLYEELKTKIMRNKNTLTDKNSNDEKGTKDKNTKAKRRTLTSTEGDNENIKFRTDMKEDARFRSDKDSALKENQSTGAIKKKINQKKTKKTDHRHTSVTDATNTINSGSNDDVRKKVNKSKDARMLVEKKKLLGQEAEKMSAEASKKKRTRNIKKSENILNKVNDPGKEFNGGAENQKSKVKWQVQLKENKNSIKPKKNIQAEEKSSNVSDVKEKDLPKDKRSEKKTKESKEKKQDVVGEKTSVKKSRLGKINENIPEIDGKDFIENKADVKEKKTRVKKAMPLKEGEEKTSKSRVKEKDAGNNETETKRSRNKRTKVGEKNGEKVVDQKKESPRKKSENCKTDKNSSVEGIKNIDSDNELVKMNAPNTQTEIPKTINYNSEEVNKLPINVNFKKENLSPKKPLELIKPVTLENIDEAVLKKLNVVSNNLKNEECEFQDKSFEKKKKNNSVNDKPLDDLKKYTVRALDEENKCEKPEKRKTLYEIKQDVKRQLKQIRQEKKMASAVEKLSVYALRHLKKMDLESNPSLKHYLGFESSSDSDSETSSDSENSSAGFGTEYTCSSASTCSCCSDSSSCSSEYSSSSCSCSNCCFNSSHYSASFSSSDSDSD